MNGEIKASNGVDIDGVGSLAGLVEEDIQRRGLMPGDRYLYAKDVAKLFGVNEMMAHRAMKVLADGQKLVRKARRGTFVGPKFKSVAQVGGQVFQVIHIVVSMDYRRNTGVSEDVFLNAVEASSPGTAVQVHYVPATHPLSYTRHIVTQIEATGGREGLIFIRSSEQVQRFLQERGVRAAIFGSIYPGITEIPWLDVDQKQIGRLMAEYAVAKGFKRFVLLMYNQWRRGDNDLINSLTETLGESGLAVNALKVHSLPEDSEYMADDIREIIKGEGSPPAILCRSAGYLCNVVKVCEDMALEVGKDVLVVSAGHLGLDLDRQYPHIEPTKSVQQQVEMLIEMLKNMVADKDARAQGVVVPVSLVVDF